MFKNFHLLHMPILVLILCLFLQQLQFLLNVVEARQYHQPYGDILEEEEHNSFQNHYETKNTPNHYEPRDRQGFSRSYQQKSYGQKYQNEYQQQPQQQQHHHINGRRRGERENSQYESIENTRFNTNNRNMGRGITQSRWPTSARTLGEQQNVNMTTNYENDQHKCQIWVPSDALDKYPDAEPVQSNKISHSEYIEVCCPGYGAMRWLGKTICRPLCENCHNGRCVEPGKCECYDEFVANDNGDCVFTCPLGCLNGRCYLDGSCKCDPGYKLDKSRKFCRPICSKGCGSSPLHNCTEPEVCGCIKGYIFSDSGCRPTCQPECGIGGSCTEPNLCNCSAGFELRDGVCQTDCYQKCDNGYCYNRNRCICKPDFTYHERSTQCIPK